MIRALVGPTASGKESVAVAVARISPVEILSLDSMKVYRGMDVGTSKASPARRAEVPHHLVDLADPAEEFSTRRWLEAAAAAEAQVLARVRIPLYVGGTALYLKSLLHGLFTGPSADPEIRRRLSAEPPGKLHERLFAADPPTAARIHPNDQRRLVRALEILEATGRPPSELRREWERRPVREARIAGIRRERADLYARIDARVDRMIAEGLVEEVRTLLARPAGIGKVARQSLGVKEIADHLEGRIPEIAEAVDLLKRRTRLFARRQATWWKHFDVRWIDAAPDDRPEELAGKVVAALEL